jgi:hypothetical protein
VLRTKAEVEMIKDGKWKVEQVLREVVDVSVEWYANE